MNETFRQLPIEEQIMDVHTKVFKHPAPAYPQLLTWGRTLMRLKLITDEVKELIDAIADGDLTEIADAGADIMVTTIGLMIEFGFPVKEILSEVSSANMTKLNDDGEPEYNEWGKVIKGKNYVAPNVENKLVEHGASQEHIDAHLRINTNYVLTQLGWPQDPDEVYLLEADARNDLLDTAHQLTDGDELSCTDKADLEDQLLYHARQLVKAAEANAENELLVLEKSTRIGAQYNLEPEFSRD